MACSNSHKPHSTCSMYPAGRALRHGRAVHPRAFTAPSRGVGWGARAAGAVPGAFPGHPYDPRKKAEGTAEYEQLRTNWGECVPYRHERLASPADLSELQQVVSETEKLRMVGSAHSFSHLSDAPDATMLSLAFMARIGDIDPEAMTVSAEGGVTLGELCRYLAPRDCALKNVASFPHLTWVGAAATGSHGSGIRNQGFAGQTAALTFVLPDGSTRRYDRASDGDALMDSVAVNLGCLGPVAEVEVDIVPSYDITQQCYTMPIVSPATQRHRNHRQLRAAPLTPAQAEYLENFHAMVDAHDSVSTFANFGDGVVEWTFQRDKVEAGTPPESFTPPATIHVSHTGLAPELFCSALWVCLGGTAEGTGRIVPAGRGGAAA